MQLSTILRLASTVSVLLWFCVHAVGAEIAVHCTELQLAPTMESFTYRYMHHNITAHHLASSDVHTANGENTTVLLHTWVGHVSDAPADLVTIAWDDACSTSALHMDISSSEAHSDESSRRALTTVACSATGSSTCVVASTPQQGEYSLVPAGFSNALKKGNLRGAKPEKKPQRGGPAAAPAPAPGPKQTQDSGRVIDVLWLYSNGPLARYGSAGIVSKLAGAVTTANLALNNSQTGFQLRAAAILYVDYTSTSLLDTLTKLQSSAGIAGSASLRDQYRADVVQMVIESDSGCGYGAQMVAASPAFAPYAYSVISSSCITQFSHLHEIGHNLGLDHNPENSGDYSTWEYGKGYRRCATATSTPPTFRTVMSYPCSSAPRIPYISTANSAVQYQGVAVGDSTHDNTRVLLQTHTIAANFRLAGN